MYLSIYYDGARSDRAQNGRAAICGRKLYATYTAESRGMQQTQNQLVSARDVQRMMTLKQERKKESFMQVVNQCCGKIRRIAVLNQTRCLFEVPDFLLGYPIYDLNECVRYVMQFLQNRGFQVTYFFPRILLVSWATAEHTLPSASPPPPPSLTTSTAAPPTNQHPNQHPNQPHHGFIKSITDFKPSGKFVLKLS
jgi:hypothetical protein